METIDLINILTKNFFLSMLIYFVLLKIINYKQNSFKKLIIISLISFINGLIYVAFIEYINQIFITFFIYFIFSIIISGIIQEKIFYSEIITFISLAIVKLTFLICIILSCIILKVLIPNIEFENIMILFLAISIELLMIYFFFKIKRFKNGFSFLQDKNKINNIGIIGFTFIGITIVIYSLLGNFKSELFNTYLFAGIIIELICIVVWVRKSITKFYKQKLKEQTVEELTNEIKEKDETITKITEENKALATINHKYSSRIRALENFTSKIAVKPELVEKFSTEFGVDFAVINEQITSLSKEFSDEMSKSIKINNELPKTGIFGIDNLLEYLNSEAIKSNINFSIKTNGNISEMIENVISQNKLETLLGDHIKDAIIAINSSEENNKDILLEIGNNEICIYDTGIEFEIDTLLKLGNEQVTTHKLTGGSGIGFMTTFETLKECKASLEIEEMKDGKYTKVVKVMFDALNEYRIKSYRAEEIRKKDEEKRIKII